MGMALVTQHIMKEVIHLTDIYVSSLLVTLRHWTNLSAVGWQQLLLSRIDSQLRYFYGERLMAGTLYYKKHSVVFVIDMLNKNSPEAVKKGRSQVK